MIKRGEWQGMLMIATFNWPFYAAALIVLIASIAGLFAVDLPEVKLVFALALAGSGYFLVGSLGVSHLIYDRSDLYRWGWLERALHGASVQQVVLCHGGFDDFSCELHERLPAANWTILDHFDEGTMTEDSIRRARRRFPPVAGTLSAPYSRWPVDAESAHVIFGMLAIHELRSEAERTAWFSEARRCLRKDGRVIIVEHLRDLANFIAFGPGFLHFHSRASWRRTWKAASLHALDEFSVTPWIRVFVLSSK